MLTIRGRKNVAEAIAHYRGEAKSTDSEPPEVHGSLWKSGRRGARYFKTEPGTPLLLYFRSRRLVENHVIAAHAALNLVAASKIAIVAQNGAPSNKFVIQATNASDPTMIEHVELTAPSADEARRWVTVLVMRRNHFTHQHARASTSAGKRPSQQELAQAGIALFKRATGDEQTMKQVAAAVKKSSDLGSRRASDLRKPEINRLSSTGSMWDEAEVYFSASSDEDEVDGEAKSIYVGVQQQLERSMNALATTPVSQFPQKMWAIPSYEDVPLRGFNYMNDHIKVTATRTLMKLVAIDCFSTGKKRLDHVASHPQNRMEIARKNGTLPPFTWVIAIQVPGSPVNFSFVMYFVPSSVVIAKLFDVANVSDKEAEEIASSLGLPPRYHILLRKFFFGPDNTFRNERFKMVPAIVEGPWLVKNAVPNKPALIGKKLTNRYFLNERYLELDLDVGSSSVATKITQLSIGYSTKLVVNLSFVLEGRESAELPEEIIGIASIINADIVNTALPIPT